MPGSTPIECSTRTGDEAEPRSFCIVAGPPLAQHADRLKVALRSRHPLWPVLIRDLPAQGEHVWKTIVVLESPEAAVARMLSAAAVGSPHQAVNQWLATARSGHKAWSGSPEDTVLVDAADIGSPELAALLHQHLPDVFGPITMAEPSTRIDPAMAMAAARLCAAHPDVSACLSDLSSAGLTFKANAQALASVAPSQSLVAEASTPVALDETQRPSMNDSDSGSVTANLRASLAEAQQELEDLYLQLRDLRVQATGGATAGRRSLRAGHLRWLDQEAADIQVDLRPLEVVEHRTWPSVQVSLNLVDGQPALRIFATGADPEVVSAWQTDGTQRGRAYMEFRPAYPPGRQRLQQLGAADWDMVSGLAVLLKRESTAMADELPVAVHRLASRLHRQLSELPNRFRYDALRVIDEASDGHGATLQFDGASFGATDLGGVRLEWTAKRLTWCLPADAQDLPLAHWPVDTAGQPVDRWVVPLAKGRSARMQNAAEMALLSDHDRALVLAVMDALPAVAPLVSERFAQGHGGRAALAQALAMELRTATRALPADQAPGLLARVASAARLRRA